MDELGIKHKMFQVNGINMHVAEKGEDPVVLLLHGFPEFWYGWRYQLTGLAHHRFRAVVPDLRGYGDSSVPPEMTSYTILHLVGDIVALMDALEQPQVFLVGHDWGAILAWYLCMFRPDRVKALVKALVNMSVLFIPRIASIKPVQFLTAMYGDAYYICRFQWRKVRKVLDEMSPRGISPDAVIYRSLINGLCKQGMFDEATKV